MMVIVEILENLKVNYRMFIMIRKIRIRIERYLHIKCAEDV